MFSSENSIYLLINRLYDLLCLMKTVHFKEIWPFKSILLKVTDYLKLLIFQVGYLLLLTNGRQRPDRICMHCNL